jgi:flagellar biosynthesis GTPase FlhF
MGATCTNRVHRILEKFNFVPKTPVPFGSASLYEKPEKEYSMQYYSKSGPKGNNRDLYLRQQLQESMMQVEKKRRLQAEALANLGENAGQATQNLEEAKTEEIESEEVDIFERKQKFDELLKRIEKHRKEKAHLRGNDLRYNVYMRKLNKLTRMDLGLDVEAYKDYINNLK